LTAPAPIITMPSAIGSQTTMSLSTGRDAYLLLVLLASGLAALQRLAKRRHRTDLAEDVECVELVPVLDEAPVLDPSDVDRAHGKGIPGRGIAKETPCVRAHIAVATHHARARPPRRRRRADSPHFSIILTNLHYCARNRNVTVNRGDATSTRLDAQQMPRTKRGSCIFSAKAGADAKSRPK